MADPSGPSNSSLHLSSQFSNVGVGAMVAVAGGVGVDATTGAHALHPNTAPIMTKRASSGLADEEVGIIWIPYNFSDLRCGRLLTASVHLSILSTGINCSGSFCRHHASEARSQ